MAENGTFVIGPDNTWAQAWEALQAGHQVREPKWHPRYSWVLDGGLQQIILVSGNSKAEWGASRNPCYDTVSGKQMLSTHWVVLPQIHPEPITV